MNSTFRSLRVHNYLLWFLGALTSNIGTWMQRTAQDWIVLTELSDHDAAAVGITMALQLGPVLVLMPWAGLIADRVNVRRMLMVTQAAMGCLALGLGVIVVTGVAQLWHVYLFALLLGVVSAIDSPIRQTFVAELVEVKDLTNAVSLNSVSFNAARLLGPAVAGVLTAVVGAGWVFVINATTFAATIIALVAIRVGELRAQPRAPRARGQIIAGFRYVRKKPAIIVILIMVGIVGTFGMNFAIYTSTMATIAFHKGAAEFGMLSSVTAIGSITGALISARQERPRMRTIFMASALFGVASAISAIMPTFESFAVSLTLIGFAALMFMTTANSMVQTTVKPSMRGRVMALYMAIFVGGTPIGAPFVGWIVNQFGPRWGLGVAAISGILAAAVCLYWLMRYKQVRVRYSRSWPQLSLGYAANPNVHALATQEIAIIEAEAQKG
ncbi:MFS family permease [Cryobacterium mesophilum]|uniref:MFS transporter n=1 Tax=Terrimesophilobacter mesophilus TaxID=433647 RepID=A0A4R8VCC4_9MICO|nr:MFS transporter [Terrimesophilobacter mesophilus]MBB5633004.1 MFS family permease [Terrimesophilobacter mesophilus]TFB79770.1 MFS transporter [Terrimesophilobacter mesophilus]